MRLFVPYPLRDSFAADARSVALGLGLLVAVAFAASFLDALAKAGGAEFYRWGLYTLTTTLFVQAAILFVATLAWPRVALTGLLTALPVIETTRVALDALLGWTGVWLLTEAVYYVCLAALLRALVRELDGSVVRRAGVAAVVGIALWGTAQLIRPFPLFNPVSDDRPRSLDIEATYTAQQRLVEATLAAVLPSTPDVEDTYFVGFAPYSAQDVFENEVAHIAELFRGEMGADGRTALLINSHRTVLDVPIANAHNLRAVLSGIAAKMGPEDVLYLHLTSHGSSDHALSVYFDNLGLNDMPADELGEIVASADLPWRVVVVSACYSGGFIEALKSPRALVMTAARADRESFGCEHGREFTYFGEALYQRNLVDHDYEAAFARAVEIVRAREAAEGLEASAPQIWVGDEIAAKLRSGKAR